MRTLRALGRFGAGTHDKVVSRVEVWPSSGKWKRVVVHSRDRRVGTLTVRAEDVDALVHRLFGGDAYEEQGL